MENIENVEKVEDSKCNKRYAIQRGSILKTRKTRNTNKNCSCCLSCLLNFIGQDESNADYRLVKFVVFKLCLT